MDFSETQRVFNTYPTIIGIDWAEREHAVFVMDTDSQDGEVHTLDNDPSTIIEWFTSLRKQHKDQNALVIMENNDTNLKHTLAFMEWVDLVEVTESKLVNFRNTFSTSGAKDDASDACSLVEMYLHHPDEFDINDPDCQRTRTLDHHARKRRKLVDKRADMVNTMRSELNKYFPQALELTGTRLDTPMACEFLTRWGTIAQLQDEEPENIRAFYESYSLREEVIQQRLKLIEEAVPVTEDPAVIDPLKKVVQGLAGSVKELTESIRSFDQTLKEEARQHEDYYIWNSFPRAGKQMIPRLIAAFGDDRSNWEEAREVQVFSGIAPVTRNSGEDRWVHWRWGAPTFLMQTFYEYANLSVQESVWASAFVEMKKEQGDGHPTAVRKLAYKWIRIMYRCWQDQTRYNEVKYIRALLRSDSPVVEYIDPEILEKVKGDVA